MQNRRASVAQVRHIVQAMAVTKDPFTHYVSCWLCGLLILNLHCLPVISQENATETATETTFAILSSTETNYTGDATMTSLTINSTTEPREVQTEMVTDLVTALANATTAQEEFQTNLLTVEGTELQNTTVFQEENATETATETTFAILSSTETNYTGDATMTSLTINSTTEPRESQTEIITDLVTALANATTAYEKFQTNLLTVEGMELQNTTVFQEVNQTTQPSRNVTDTMTMTMEVTDNDNTSLSANVTEDFPPLGTVVVPATIVLSTPDLFNPSRAPTPLISPIIPVLIFAGLLFLMTIMIFIVLYTKSRKKRSISTYNLTPAANGNSSQIGYRNTAYEQGDVANDIDVECSMQEIRLEGKPRNENILQNYEGFEEELTPL
ncbi:uncharacterized protein LOC110978675 isoform X2 [Acanthaster planci]|uniref:Uncharacterized protein LOC110978675 isoform X2 n=1 Tax=Acanthaster planci TaxID=133434 RepID=A0A8B7YAZ4_ACAPL|nr:uncharacterized protein LOC110978675 isoform X2 [Acanthaster planci]